MSRIGSVDADMPQEKSDGLIYDLLLRLGACVFGNGRHFRVQGWNLILKPSMGQGTCAAKKNDRLTLAGDFIWRLNRSRIVKTESARFNC